MPDLPVLKGLSDAEDEELNLSSAPPGKPTTSTDLDHTGKSPPVDLRAI
jgi:hypothetical protein